jgi:uncharacterized protein
VTGPAETPERVVFDCTVFAQALINPRGPAGACVIAAQSGRLRLFISEYVLAEVRELPGKLPPKLRVDAGRVEAFIFDLAKYSELIEAVPELFVYPRDPDDAHYVNLAMAAQARLIVSRDRDLLDLMDPATADARDFQARFPTLRVTDPLTLLRELERKSPPAV